MKSVSMFEAKANLSRYVSSVERREEPFIIIMRNGKPAARLVPYEEEPHQRIGIAKGILPEMPSLEEFNSIDVENDFGGKEDLF